MVLPLTGSTSLGPSSTTRLACGLGRRHLRLGTHPQANPASACRPSRARRPTAPRRRLLRLGVSQRLVEGAKGVAAAKGARACQPELA
eukprot:scaffold80518_cov57-Phaeocystis_antarctica.AAC.1